MLKIWVAVVLCKALSAPSSNLLVGQRRGLCQPIFTHYSKRALIYISQRLNSCLLTSSNLLLAAGSAFLSR